MYEAHKDSWDMIRPLPSSKTPHFRNEARCTTFLVKMSFICPRMKNNFHIKGWAPTLVLKQRPGRTRKWPIGDILFYVSAFVRNRALTFWFLPSPYRCFSHLLHTYSHGSPKQRFQLVNSFSIPRHFYCRNFEKRSSKKCSFIIRDK